MFRSKLTVFSEKLGGEGVNKMQNISENILSVKTPHDPQRNSRKNIFFLRKPIFSTPSRAAGNGNYYEEGVRFRLGGGLGLVF